MFRALTVVDSTGMETKLLYDPELVEAITEKLCRRYRLEGDECADFTQDVHLKLIENDYARLRTFQGKCKLETYQFVVVKRLAIDYIVSKRGKWTSSAKAKQLGPAAVDLEILLYREHNPLDEAVRIMVSRDRHDLSENAVRELAVQLPVRAFGRRDGGDDVSELPDPARTDSPVLDHERRARFTAMRAKLIKALECLDPEDRLILQMRYWDGFTIVRISKILSLGRRPHDRVARILKQLKTILENDGVEVDDVRDLFLNE